LAGRGRHWVLVYITREPRQRSANAPRGAAGAFPCGLPKSYSEPTLTIYLILCMGDKIDLKIYSGRGHVRQQDAILRVPRQRSATLRAARPYAIFLGMASLPSGLEPKIDLRARSRPP